MNKFNVYYIVKQLMVGHNSIKTLPGLAIFQPWPDLRLRMHQQPKVTRES
jgi:hypothetical protein